MLNEWQVKDEESTIKITGEESNWKRSVVPAEEPSRNLCELKKRLLLSRCNRIYAASQTQQPPSNGYCSDNKELHNSARSNAITTARNAPASRITCYSPKTHLTDSTRTLLERGGSSVNSGSKLIERPRDAVCCESSDGDGDGDEAGNEHAKSRHVKHETAFRSHRLRPTSSEAESKFNTYLTWRTHANPQPAPTARIPVAIHFQAANRIPATHLSDSFSESPSLPLASIYLSQTNTESTTIQIKTSNPESCLLPPRDVRTSRKPKPPCSTRSMGNILAAQHSARADNTSLRERRKNLRPKPSRRDVQIAKVAPQASTTLTSQLLDPKAAFTKRQTERIPQSAEKSVGKSFSQCQIRSKSKCQETGKTLKISHAVIESDKSETSKWDEEEVKVEMRSGVGCYEDVYACGGCGFDASRLPTLSLNDDAQAKQDSCFTATGLDKERKNYASRTGERLESQADVGDGEYDEQEDEEPDETFNDMNGSENPGPEYSRLMSPYPSWRNAAVEDGIRCSSSEDLCTSIISPASSANLPAHGHTLLLSSNSDTDNSVMSCHEEMSCFPICSSFTAAANGFAKADTARQASFIPPVMNAFSKAPKEQLANSQDKSDIFYESLQEQKNVTATAISPSNDGGNNASEDSSYSHAGVCVLQNDAPPPCPFANAPVPVPSSAFSEHDERMQSPLKLLKPPPVRFLLLTGKGFEAPFTKIYTDWANHYLEKARCKRHIQDLQVDVTDGVILADVVEAVTNQKVPDLSRKPKNVSQMLDNIQSCLVFLSSLGVTLDGITARDIRDGHLKSILSLFFQLSRYKQQQKQQDRDRHNLMKQSAEMQASGVGARVNGAVTTGRPLQETSKLPSLFGKHGGGTSIPLPASTSGPSSTSSTAGNKRISQDKIKSAHHLTVPAVGNGGSHLYSGVPNGGNIKPASGGSSRSTSPLASSGIPQSFIPTPASARTSLHEKHLSNAKGSSGSQSASTSAKQSSVRSSSTTHNNNATNGPSSTTTVVNGKSSGTGNTSMLEKFKFFKDKDKTDKSKGGSKRTSSSSGFSSARSERSDSSASLCNEGNKAGLVEGSSSVSLSRETGSHLAQHSSLVNCGDHSYSSVPPTTATVANNVTVTATVSTPRLGIKSFRQKLGKAIASKDSKSSSPKNARKEEQFQQIEQSSKSFQHSSKIQSQSRAKSEYLSAKDAPSSTTTVGTAASSTQPDNSQARRSSIEKDRTSNNNNHGGNGGKNEVTKLRVPRTMDVVETSEGTGSNSNGSDFLRRSKPSSSGLPTSNRDVRNRYSGTGIPSRNSIVNSSSSGIGGSGGANNNSASRDELSTAELSVSSTNINNCAGTGIPKPTAAVKGTTKPIAVKETGTGTSCTNINQASNNNNNNIVSGGDKALKKSQQTSTPNVSTVGAQNSKSGMDNKETSGATGSPPGSDKSNNDLAFDLDQLSEHKLHKNESPLSSSSGISVAMISPMPLNNNSILPSISSSVDSALNQSNFTSLENSVIMTPNDQQPQCAPSAESPSTSTTAPEEERTGRSKGESSSSKTLVSASPMDQSQRGPEHGRGEKLSSQSVSDVIVECDEDDLMLNVTPMEPLESIMRNSPYGYMKSPPGSGFLSPKSPGQLGRMGPAHPENGAGGSGGRSGTENRHLLSHFCNSIGRNGSQHQQSGAGSKYASSRYKTGAGDYDYPDIDTLDLNGGGYLSDGDLLLSGSNGNRGGNDGYLSESSASIYNPRRLPTSSNNIATGNGRCRDGFLGGRNNKLITEDRSYSLDANGIDGLTFPGKPSTPASATAFSTNACNDQTSTSKSSSSLPFVPIQCGSDQCAFNCNGQNRENKSNRGSKGRRFDDSSSLSSGISDLNEIPTDLTSSELSSPYASLQRTTTEESCRKKKDNNIGPQSIIYRVVGCRSGNSNRRQVDNNATPQASVSTPNSIESPRKNDAGLPYPQYVNAKESGTHFRANASSSDSSGASQFKNGGYSVHISQHQMNYQQSNGGSPYSPQLQQPPLHRSSNKSDGKFASTPEMEKKRSLKEEYYGGGDAVGHEVNEHYRSCNGYPSNYDRRSSSSHHSSGGRSGSSGGGLPPQYGHYRGSGNNGNGGSISVTKYNYPVNGKVLLTTGPDDHKSSHLSLPSKSPNSQGGGNGSNGDMGIQYSPGAVSSPKTRTKVKVSGGTQTTNDLHEMNRHHHHAAALQRHQQQQNHQYPHHSSTGDVDYLSPNSSRHSGSFSQASGPSSKSLSLTTPTAAQLSQSLRERILGSQSLPKGATSSADYAAILATIQKQQHQFAQQQHLQVYGTPNASKERMTRYNKTMMNDGSMSDTGGYSNYAELQNYGLPNGGPPGNSYSWARHSTGYASSITSAPTRLIGGGSMTEAESLESLNSTSSLAAQLHEARSNSLSHSRAPNHHHQKENVNTSPSRSPRLNRSNSISHFRERTFPRSTKSEKVYPSMMQRTEDISPYSTSPVPGNNLPISPSRGPHQNRGGGSGQGPYPSAHASNHSVRLSMSPYSGFLTKMATKEDEINGSSLSLVSTASSIYSSQEDRQAYEVRKLKRELVEAQEKVQTLTNQLSTNAHVVAAFEQSLSNMTHRLQSLTLTAEQKDSELLELRQTIELLRKQSIEAGLTVANFQSVSSRDGSPIARQLSADSVSSINSISSACSGTSHSHASSPSGKIQMTPLGTPTHGNHLNSAPDSPNINKKHAKNKGWLRSSFTKAFSRSKSKARNGTQSESNSIDESHIRPSNLHSSDMYSHNGCNGGVNSIAHLHHGHGAMKHHHDHSGGPVSPLLISPKGGHSSSGQSNGCSGSTGSHSPHSNGLVKGSSSSSAICDDLDLEKHKSVDDLKKQLREKEMVLTDIRLEALTSAHQLESLKETVNKMRNEMLSLKQDNDRLQRLVTCKSLASSQSSLQPNELESFDRRLSASEVPTSSSIDILLADPLEKSGKRVIVTVFLGCHGSYERYMNAGEGFPASECAIGTIPVNNKTKWDLLDSLVRRAFKDYVLHIDPATSLGLSADSIQCYCVGEVIRSKEHSIPELLPCGYLVGDVNKIRICLKGAVSNGSVDALAFETLVSKPILQRYVTWLNDHGRLMLCGPSGTGKSYLARKLGEFFVAKSGKDPCPEAIATFSADHKNNKELKQYLDNLAEQCESGSADLPSVIILDNLHQVVSFGEIFNKFLHSKHVASSIPLIVGTMSQTTSSATNSAQIHYNFRWVLLRNHAEPVKGLLGRFLQRRLIEADVQSGTKNLELSRVMEWVPEAWHHINKFLEKFNSPDATIGPRLLLSCPADVANSQVWFTDLWQYSIVPYLIEAVKEGLQLYGKRNVSWEDPSQFLLQTYPWNESSVLSTTKAALLRLRPEDAGFEVKPGSGNMAANKSTKSDGTEPDPLMNMLMRLQEAANYSGAHGNDSDTTSLDSHASHDSKEFTASA